MSATITKFTVIKIAHTIVYVKEENHPFGRSQCHDASYNARKHYTAKSFEMSQETKLGFLHLADLKHVTLRGPCALSPNKFLSVLSTPTPTSPATAIDAGCIMYLPKLDWELGRYGLVASVPLLPRHSPFFSSAFLPMSQVAFAAMPLSNGTGSESLNGSSREVLYKKLLRLHDDVFAGKHPSLKVLGSVVQDVAPVASTMIETLLNMPKRIWKNKW